MRYTLYALLLVIIMLVGCTHQDQEIAKDVAEGTANDIAETVKTGIEDLTKDVGYAAPDMKEDIVKAFWETIEAIDILVYGESVEDIPTPAEIHGMQVLQGFGRGVVKSAQAVRDHEISESKIAFEKLAEVLDEEIRVSQIASGEEQTPVPETKPLPTGEEIHNAWVTFAQFADTPDKSRELFLNIKKAVESISEVKVTAGIYGPVNKADIGNVASKFVSTMKIGEVSSPFRFKKGIVLVQMIDQTEETVEVGFVYIPMTEMKEINPDTGHY